MSVLDPKPCPFCGSAEHLSVGSVGSLTGDMPARPHRVVCRHIDHDEVSGPVAYGRQEAIIAWNRRSTAPSGQAPLEGVKAELKRLVRNAAVATVDAIHGFTMEFSSQPAQHREEYDLAESVIGHVFSALLPASGEPVAWRYQWKDACGNWSEWMVCTVDPRDWTWPPAWKDFDAEPLYASPPANGAVELPGLNGTTEATSAVGVSAQTGEAVPANLPPAGSKTPASGAGEAGWQLVPVAALKWLNGEGPDHNGDWFGDVSGRGNFWWRKHFSDMLAAAPTEGR